MSNPILVALHHARVTTCARDGSLSNIPKASSWITHVRGKVRENRSLYALSICVWS